MSSIQSPGMEAPDIEHERETLLAGSSTSKEVNPAKEVLRDAPNFLREQLPKLGKKVRSEFDAIIRYNQDSVKSPPQTEEDVIASIDSIPLERLATYVDFQLNITKSADADLQQKRSRGFHMRVARLQELAMTFDRFLRAYSGIVSLVQKADPQFSSVAFTALSLLFATIKVKIEAEEAIHNCMLLISDRMPDLKIYQRIYDDSKLRIMINETYRDIIIFARKVIVYFQASGPVRYLRHFNAKFEFQDMEQRMRENSNRISIKCETLLAEKIDDLTEKNQILTARQYEISVREVAKILNLQNYPTESSRKNQLSNEQERLRNLYSGDRRRQKIDAQHFLETTIGKDWDGPCTMLLLLYGREEVTSSSENSHSWLSLVAVELAQGYIQSEVAVAYERCDRLSTLKQTLSCLSFQLLERNPRLLEKPQDLREIHSQISRTGDGQEYVEALRRTLLHIINLHQGRVYIILNRPELCEANAEESCTEYISTMLSIVRDATVEVKIMMVLKSELWDFDKNKKGLGVTMVDKKIFRPVRLDQGSSSQPYLIRGTPI